MLLINGQTSKQYSITICTIADRDGVMDCAIKHYGNGSRNVFNWCAAQRGLKKLNSTGPTPTPTRTSSPTSLRGSSRGSRRGVPRQSACRARRCRPTAAARAARSDRQTCPQTFVRRALFLLFLARMFVGDARVLHVYVNCT